MDKRNKGWMLVISGPMFAGKTSRLIEFLEREMISGKKTILFKPEIDIRYSKEEVVTHKGVKVPAVMVPIKEISKAHSMILQNAANAEVVGIDEAQFWDAGVMMPALLDSIANMNKRVYASVLNRDHLGQVFGNAGELMAIADEVQALTAICVRCGEEATFTQRVIEGQPVFGPTIAVGGKEMYEPRCRECFVYPKSLLRTVETESRCVDIGKKKEVLKNR